jgi:hypothetical protein
VGCNAVGWVGATTLRASAREEKQQRQHAAVRLNRVCSVFTQQMKFHVVTLCNACRHLPAFASGQLPDQGSSTCDAQQAPI